MEHGTISKKMNKEVSAAKGLNFKNSTKNDKLDEKW